MAPTKVILLSCGSFNPPTNMHLRMFEIARDHLHRLGNYIVIGGLISPVHDGYGKKDLVSSTHRIGMLKQALQNSEWISLSDWECKQETWSRTRVTLQHHQNQINSIMNRCNNDEIDGECLWVPDHVRNGSTGPIQLKLLCGADLLESFATPGLWSDDDLEAIIGQHGLVVISRENSNPSKFIYDSDLLTKYYNNIIMVTNWIRSDVSSTKIRRALRRNESVKYLLPDKVIDYIYRQSLYGAKDNKYTLQVPTNNILNLLTPSPTNGDILMESPQSPQNENCIVICNKNLFSSFNVAKNSTTSSNSGSVIVNNRMSIDTVDGKNRTNSMKHPGQAVKIVTESSGNHTIVKTHHHQHHHHQQQQQEVRSTTSTACSASSASSSSTSMMKQPQTTTAPVLKSSKSCTNFTATEQKRVTFQNSRSNSDLQECKSCDENLIKFIFTRHGIQVISDVETIV